MRRTPRGSQRYSSLVAKPGRRTVHGAGEYHKYIRSPEWQAVRERFAASKLQKNCWGCGIAWRRGFHLHHRTYKNLGVESLHDLVPVCPECHESIHRLVKATGWDIWKSTRAVHRYAKKGISPAEARLRIEHYISEMASKKSGAPRGPRK